MNEMFEKFPKILLADPTYKFIDLRIPVYLLLVLDGDGLSEIVVLFILTDETKIVIESIHAFKKYNESWPKTHPVISDKGFNERNAFSSCFSSAQLLICVYHTFRSSRPEMFRKKTFSVNFAKFLRTYFFTEHLCSCFCTLRWLRREINCEKIGIISAQPANCLEILR